MEFQNLKHVANLFTSGVSIDIVINVSITNQSKNIDLILKEIIDIFSHSFTIQI